jgi:hypothetical protein
LRNAKRLFVLLLLAGVAGPASSHGFSYEVIVLPAIWLAVFIGFIGGLLGVGHGVSRFKGLGTSLLVLVLVTFVVAVLVGDVGFMTFIIGALPLAASYVAVELVARVIDRKEGTRNTNENATREDT